MRDELGDGRSRFPHALYLVAGSQADAAGGANTLTVARLTGVARTHRSLRDDDEESDSDESDSEEEAAATGGGGARAKPKPTLAVRQLAHHGAVTRTRSCPTSPHVVATFSETGHVQVWDVSPQLASLAGDASASKKGGAKLGRAPPRQVFTGHAAEGYALDWSTPAPGRLLSGDSTGSIHLWEPAPGGRWAVGAALFRGHGSAAVEDVAWSPVEGGVFASVGCDGAACVWDVRQRSGPALRVVAHAGCDANCVAWSSLAPAMLATAAEDGSFKIWDLRSWGSGGSGSGGSGGSGGSVAPVASFSYHRGAVVSLQWAGFDASTIASAGEDDSVCVWDLAVERDAEEEAAALAEAGARGALPPPELPPQLMFVHQGQKEVKELRWHPQIPGLVVTTAAAGFMVWKPGAYLRSTRGCWLMPSLRTFTYRSQSSQKTRVGTTARRERRARNRNQRARLVAQRRALGVGHPLFVAALATRLENMPALRVGSLFNVQPNTATAVWSTTRFFAVFACLVNWQMKSQKKKINHTSHVVNILYHKAPHVQPKCVVPSSVPDVSQRRRLPFHENGVDGRHIACAVCRRPRVSVAVHHLFLVRRGGRDVVLRRGALRFLLLILQNRVPNAAERVERNAAQLQAGALLNTAEKDEA